MKDYAKGAVGYLRGEATVWAPFGLLILAASFSAWPLAALLLCGGLVLVLVLRRVFKLGKAFDDPARIAANRPPTMQEGEQGDVVGYLAGEVVGWGFFGFLYLAVGERAGLLIALIGFGGILLVLMWRRAGAATTLGFLAIVAICTGSFFLMLPQTQSAPPMPALSLSYRNDVIQIQQRLIELGFLPERFFPEGNWGPMSRQALVEFKKQSGLSSNTGNFTTRRALFSGQAKHALSGQR